MVAAGATIVPIDGPTDVARLDGDILASWKSELAPGVATDAVFRSMQFRPKTVSAHTRVSLELADDGPGSEAIIRQSMAAAIAHAVDFAALSGTGTAPEPRGLRNTAGVATGQSARTSITAIWSKRSNRYDSETTNQPSPCGTPPPEPISTPNSTPADNQRPCRPYWPTDSRYFTPQPSATTSARPGIRANRSRACLAKSRASSPPKRTVSPCRTSAEFSSQPSCQPVTPWGK